MRLHLSGTDPAQEIGAELHNALLNQAKASGRPLPAESYRDLDKTTEGTTTP